MSSARPSVPSHPGTDGSARSSNLSVAATKGQTPECVLDTVSVRERPLRHFCAAFSALRGAAAHRRDEGSSSHSLFRPSLSNPRPAAGAQRRARAGSVPARLRGAGLFEELRALRAPERPAPVPRRRVPRAQEASGVGGGVAVARAALGGLLSRRAAQVLKPRGGRAVPQPESPGRRGAGDALSRGVGPKLFLGDRQQPHSRFRDHWATGRSAAPLPGAADGAWLGAGRVVLCHRDLRAVSEWPDGAGAGAVPRDARGRRGAEPGGLQWPHGRRGQSGRLQVSADAAQRASEGEHHAEPDHLQLPDHVLSHGQGIRQGRADSAASRGRLHDRPRCVRGGPPPLRPRTQLPSRCPDLAFAEIPCIVSYSLFVAAYGKKGDMKKSLEFLYRARQRGLAPTAHTYHSLLTTAGKMRSLTLVQHVLTEIERDGLKKTDPILQVRRPSAFALFGSGVGSLFSAIIRALSSCNAIEKAQSFHDELCANWKSYLESKGIQGTDVAIQLDRSERGLLQGIKR
eukprot:scaffold63_cov306-Pinguiococcus_pyrenoidosus.AAC.23